MTIEFLPDVAERLRILAEREERTKASLIREAVRKLLAERENAA
jgi:predicted transcriptional regulator